MALRQISNTDQGNFVEKADVTSWLLGIFSMPLKFKMKKIYIYILSPGFIVMAYNSYRHATILIKSHFFTYYYKITKISSKMITKLKISSMVLFRTLFIAKEKQSCKIVTGQNFYMVYNCFYGLHIEPIQTFAAEIRYSSHTLTLLYFSIISEYCLHS